MTREIPLKAVVDENEKAALIIAAEQIGTSLTAAAGEPITVDCDFAVSLETLKSSRERSIVVTSLLREVENYKTPWPEVELRLRNDYEALMANPSAIVFVTTIFRHVAHPEGDQARLMRIRIRRLDRFAAEISREFGVMVIDIDRDLADIGASKLRTDYRLTGQYAKPVAAKCIALAVISTGLDEYVSFEIQEAAKLAVANDNLAQGIPPTTDVKPSNILSLGTGRHKQTVKTIVDTNTESHAGWLVHLLLSGQFGVGDAFSKLKGSIARRGLRASAIMILGAVRESRHSKRRVDTQR